MDMDHGSARLGETQESRWMAESLGQGGLGVQGAWVCGSDCGGTRRLSPGPVEWALQGEPTCAHFLPHWWLASQNGIRTPDPPSVLMGVIAPRALAQVWPLW